MPYVGKRGIKRKSIQGTRMNCVWTPEEESRLKTLWNEGHRERYLKAALGGRTWLGIWSKAHQLGLTADPEHTHVPQGYITMRQASRRAGFAPQTLRAMMEREGIVLRRSRTGNKKRKGQDFRGVRIMVDPQDVEDVVARAMTCESIFAAARRLHISDRTLRRLLLEAGIVTEIHRGCRPRLNPADVDRVVQAHRSRSQSP